jgi:hypothetical protein
MMNNTSEGVDFCPHCGPGNSIVEYYQDGLGYHKVGCGCCGSHSGSVPKSDPNGKQRVIDLWNKRIGSVDKLLKGRPMTKEDEKLIAEIESMFRPDYNAGYVTAGEIHMIRKVIQILIERDLISYQKK